MIVPFTALELRLIDLLMGKTDTLDELGRLRDLFIEMYASGLITDVVAEKCLDSLTSKCAAVANFENFIEETRVFLRLARAIRHDRRSS